MSFWHSPTLARRRDIAAEHRGMILAGVFDFEKSRME
jgi:hypothetical protein